MLLGILSDTHDELARATCAVDMLRAEGAEALIHCGDLSTPRIVAACSVLPCYFVFGNHDADNVPALNQAAADFGANCLGWGGVVQLAGKKIGVAHGHMTVDLKRVLSEQPSYLLFGHAHFSSDNVIDGVRRINPGALFRAEVFTVALLDLKADVLRFLRLDK